jgi:hypothetical protein
MPGNFRYIPEEKKKLILTMSLRGMKTKEIEDATGITSRTIRRVTNLWKLTGEVVKRPLERGRPRILTSIEVLVSPEPTFISNCADIDSSLTKSTSRASLSKDLTYMYQSLLSSFVFHPN